MFLVADTIQEFKLAVSPETSLIEIIDLIEQLKREDKVPQQLFVIQHSQLLGIFALFDLIYLITSKANLERVKVAEVMKPAISLEPDYDYQQALSIMREHNIKCLPIINQGGELIEIVTPESIATKLQTELLNTKIQLQEQTIKYDYFKQEFDDLVKTNKLLQHQIDDSLLIEEELCFRVAFEKLITRISTDFVNIAANKIDDAINQALQTIARFINIDRSYVFLLAEDGEKVNNTHEWCSQRILSRIEQLKDIYVEDLNLFIEKLQCGEIFQLIDIEELELQELVKEQIFPNQDIKSLIILPIACSGNLIGFLGFESLNTIIWTENSIILLKIVAEILGNVLERKELEETLKVSEERYARAINAGKVGVWEWDIQTNEVYIDSNLKAMLGYKDEEIANQFTSWLGFVHSSDVGLVKAEINAYLEELIPKYEIEHRMLHKNGDILGFLSRGTVVRDETGMPIFMAGSSTDITARKQIENKLKASLKEKEVLLKEIHHRVKNNLQIISSLLRLQSGYIKDKQALEIFQDSQNRIRAMALIHENLYQINNLAAIEFSEYIRKLTNNLISFYAIDNHIKISTNIEKAFLKIDTAIPCALIINELISNSIKHAFKNSDEGEIYVEFIALQENKYSLSVSDNGVGVQESIDSLKKQSLGLELVWNLVEQLEGTIVYNCKFGTSFRITFTENNEI
ncbi:MAG: histidine kinase dimerization/phosphoacceptor domain -containing protein [Rivularia sp. (in: cyanobacteria)]